ncbi:acyltransferase [Sulfurimonas sp. HSL-1656]|uniref:acyltransferase n=1 Tax=Thiomicrolovo subterrani TaxID=3131934 RepID=UPI0031F8029A
MKIIYKAIYFLINKVINALSKVVVPIYFRLNGICFSEGLDCKGLPYLSIQGQFNIGKNFKNNNRLSSNPIGGTYRSLFVVRKNGVLIIGENTGLSGVSIVCHSKITIGDNVKIGGNTCIYDTDFHSLDMKTRRDPFHDKQGVKSAEIFISDDVFIGAHSLILKGVNIGKGSIVGAGSVVTTSIPGNEVWAGNPAKFIRKISDQYDD